MATRRLTNKMLEAVIMATAQVEAEGEDGCQGYQGKEATQMYEAAILAKTWAQRKLSEREASSSKRRTRWQASTQA